MTKRKDERRKLLQEDEFLNRMERAARYTQQNPWRVAAWFALLFVLAGAWSAYGVLSNNKSGEQATLLYSKVEKQLQTPFDDEKAEVKYASKKEKHEALLSGLDEIIQSESGVIQKEAVIYKIGRLIDLGRHDELKDLYTQLVDKGGNLKFMGLLGLGDMLFAEEKYAEAISKYEAINSLKGADFEDLVIYKVALCHQASGDLDSAKTGLGALVDRFQGSEKSPPPILSKARELLEEIEGSSESKG